MRAPLQRRPHLGRLADAHRVAVLGALTCGVVGSLLLWLLVALAANGGRVNYAVQSAGVVLVTVVWFLWLMWLTYLFRKQLVAANNPIALPAMCFTVGLVSILIAWQLVRVYSDPDVPLVSAFGRTWWSFGWKTGELVFMGCRIDSPVAYTLIMVYQVTRCVLGSLLSNAFFPYMSALQSELLHEKIVNKQPLLFARFLTDLYGSAASISDLILYVSSFDIFLVSSLTATVTNYIITFLLLNAEAKEDGTVHGEVVKRLVEADLDKTKASALFGLQSFKL